MLWTSSRAVGVEYILIFESISPFFFSDYGTHGTVTPMPNGFGEALMQVRRDMANFKKWLLKQFLSTYYVSLYRGIHLLNCDPPVYLAVYLA